MERLDRYGTIGTPRIVQHPSNCPPNCPQAYARASVRMSSATPILSGAECVRKNFAKQSQSPYGHYPGSDSPINGGAGMGGPCTGLPPPLPPPTSSGMLGAGPPPSLHHGPPTASPTINLHNRHHQSHSGGSVPPGGGGSGESVIDGDNLSQMGPPQGGGGASSQFGCKNPNKLFGVSPSDIDKYSRVVFPVCFVCFNLMYWIIYLHISTQEIEGLVPAQ